MGESPATVVMLQIKRAQSALEEKDFAKAEEELDKTVAFLDALKLTEPQIPAIVYIRRAGVRFARGNFTGAEEDFVRGEKGMKGLGDMDASDYLVRAQVRLQLRQLPEAEDDVRKSLAMAYGKATRESKETLMGVVLYCQGKFARAAKSWNAAAVGVGDTGCNFRWCALTRMGSEEGATRELEARGEGDYSDRNTEAVWNGSISQYLCGRLTKERLMEIASTLRGGWDDIELRKCQAYFFIAAKNLGKNDKEAKEELSKCHRSKQATAYEFLMAEADLDRLKSVS